MTPQEIFNIAYTGVIAQGERSADPNNGCRYRGPNGLKCAVGFMIDDDTAHRWDKFGGIEEVIDRATDVPDWIESNRDLLAMIQSAHDEHDDLDFFVEDFKTKMVNVANQFNLEIPA